MPRRVRSIGGGGFATISTVTVFDKARSGKLLPSLDSVRDLQLTPSVTDDVASVFLYPGPPCRAWPANHARPDGHDLKSEFAFRRWLCDNSGAGVTEGGER